MFALGPFFFFSKNDDMKQLLLTADINTFILQCVTGTSAQWL